MTTTPGSWPPVGHGSYWRWWRIEKIFSEIFHDRSTIVKTPLPLLNLTIEKMKLLSVLGEVPDNSETEKNQVG
jgi:hypothetical protein